MNILITICGRAGSKGVKNKNIRDFLGYPLINYTVASAELFKQKRSTDHIDICVNSDSKELLSMFEKRSDIVSIKRPTELAQDSSPKVPVIIDSLEHMETKMNKRYDYVIDLDITSPLRKTQDIENALFKALEQTKADVIFSVVPSRRNPYFNMVQRKDGKIEKILESDFIRRQQAPQVYDMNASIYCYKRDSLLQVFKRSPFDGKCDITLMKDTGIIDIDSEEDFELMEVIAKYLFTEEFSELYRFVITLGN